MDGEVPWEALDALEQAILHSERVLHKTSKVNYYPTPRISRELPEPPYYRILNSPSTKEPTDYCCICGDRRRRVGEQRCSECSRSYERLKEICDHGLELF